MNSFERLPHHIQTPYREGCSHRDNLLAIIDTWPLGELSQVIAFKDIDSGFRDRLKAALTDILAWINTSWLEVFQGTLISQEYVMNIWRELEETLKEAEYIDATQSDVKEGMEKVLSSMISVSSHATSEHKTRKVQPSAYIPDTAFILMWMDRSQPQLAKVRDAIKEVCASFNIIALRADDVEHSDEVTEVVLQRIADSEFIVADLTGERPNVYYEVGYAHAMKKRMILYRKKGTNLHFNLASYSIPEYTNLTDLKTRLKKRFEAILGREAMDSTSKTSIKPASQ